MPVYYSSQPYQAPVINPMAEITQIRERFGACLRAMAEGGEAGQSARAEALSLWQRHPSCVAELAFDRNGLNIFDGSPRPRGV